MLEKSPSLNDLSGTPLHQGKTPRLLGGLAFGSDEASSSIRAHVLELHRAERIHERIRISDLVKELWPLEGQTRGFCRTLRSLNDSSKQDFLLRVSRRTVWVRTDFVRAVVETSRVTFLDPNHPTFPIFMQEFRSAMNRAEGEEAFTTWVIECIFCAAVEMHSLRLQMLKPVVENILDNVRSQAFSSVLKLYPLKTTLSSFVEQMRPLVQGLHQTLHLDADGGNDSGGLSRSFSWDTDWVGCQALEDCIYNWSRHAEEIMTEAVLLSARIEDSMRFSEASMSCTRNRLLNFELWTNVATVSVGAGALISGVFGMNLNNHGFNAAPGMFYAVCASIAGVMLIIVAVSLFLIARSQRHYNDNAPRFGNNKFFRCISDDQYVLRLTASLPHGETPRLQRLLQELTEKALPQQEHRRRSPMLSEQSGSSQRSRPWHSF